MRPGVLRRPVALGVDVVALAAVAVHPSPLYVVLLLYWSDLVAGVARTVFETTFATPRAAYSPTEPPAVNRNGDPGPLRLLTPKLGTVRPFERLPPVAVHNLKPAATGSVAVAASAAVAALTATVLDPPFALGTWPTSGFAVAGGLAVVAKHGTIARRFVRSGRRPATGMLPFGAWVGSMLVAAPVVAVDAVHRTGTVDPTAGFTAVALLFVVGRAAATARGASPPDGGDPFELPAPGGRPDRRFRVDRRAVRAAGFLDGLVPRIDWSGFGVGARLAAFPTAGAAGFLAAGALSPSPTPALLAGVGVGLAVVVVAFGLVGVAHFELAFGAMEYRLYGDELVAYDTRLGAVQWRASLAAVEGVSVEHGPWAAPPGTDAATVSIDRSDLDVDSSPYGYYRQALAYVESPEAVADRLRRATGRRPSTAPTGDGSTGGPRDRADAERTV